MRKLESGGGDAVMSVMMKSSVQWRCPLAFLEACKSSLKNYEKAWERSFCIRLTETLGFVEQFQVI